MTGKKILKRALSYLMEKPGDDAAFLFNAPELINALIAECVPVQNSRNRARGEAEIKSLAIEELDDEVNLDEIFTEVAIPIGLASAFYNDELDFERANIFRTRFENTLAQAKKYFNTDISDSYGGGV